MKKVWDKGPNPDRRLQGRAWQKLRLRWLEEHPLCVRCEREGRVRLATTLDHIKPRSAGGDEAETNLQGLCEPCHRKKSAADRGYTYKPRRRVGLDGWSVPDDDDA